MPQTHELNSFAGSFEHLVSGAKRSDIRANDRDYQVGDVVTFKEGWLENGEFVYTGRKISGIISHIDTYGCLDGFVNLSLKRMGLLVV